MSNQFTVRGTWWNMHEHVSKSEILQECSDYQDAVKHWERIKEEWSKLDIRPYCGLVIFKGEERLDNPVQYQRQ